MIKLSYIDHISPYGVMVCIFVALKPMWKLLENLQKVWLKRPPNCVIR